MLSRPVPPVLWWLAGLITLSLGAAFAAIVVIQLETRHAAQTQADAITGGDWKRGRVAIARYACGACHVIPGISGANGQVGPDLTGIGVRPTIAGRLSNDPENMARWLMHPQAVVPGNGMPEQGITPREARDMAAYLYARK